MDAIEHLVATAMSKISLKLWDCLRRRKRKMIVYSDIYRRKKYLLELIDIGRGPSHDAG